MSAPICRDHASRINPFISNIAATDTMVRCERTLRTLGVMITNDSGGVDMGPLYLIFETIAEALSYEAKGKAG